MIQIRISISVSLKCLKIVTSLLTLNLRGFCLSPAVTNPKVQLELVFRRASYSSGEKNVKYRAKARHVWNWSLIRNTCYENTDNEMVKDQL